MADEIDRKILRALHHSPRASFRLIGEVAGVSEQTAARRYQALRREGVMRVVGLVNPEAAGGRAGSPASAAVPTGSPRSRMRSPGDPTSPTSAWPPVVRRSSA